MKRIIALTLFAALLCGQQTGVVFSKYTAPSGAIVSVTIGTSHCNFFAQLPAPGQVHIGCYDGATLALNSVAIVTSQNAEGNYTFGWDFKNNVCPSGVWCGSITWQLSPGVASNSINYAITGTLLPNPGMETSESGTF